MLYILPPMRTAVAPREWRERSTQRRSLDIITPADIGKRIQWLTSGVQGATLRLMRNRFQPEQADINRVFSIVGSNVHDGNHQLRSTAIGIEYGKRVGVPEEYLRYAADGGGVHDIGLQPAIAHTLESRGLSTDIKSLSDGEIAEANIAKADLADHPAEGVRMVRGLIKDPLLQHAFPHYSREGFQIQQENIKRHSNDSKEVTELLKAGAIKPAALLTRFGDKLDHISFRVQPGEVERIGEEVSEKIGQLCDTDNPEDLQKELGHDYMHRLVPSGIPNLPTITINRDQGEVTVNYDVELDLVAQHVKGFSRETFMRDIQLAYSSSFDAAAEAARAQWRKDVDFKIRFNFQNIAGESEGAEELNYKVA